MAITFFNKFILPDDAEGWGLWLTEHWYEHVRFILTARGLVNPVNLIEYDILSWSDEPGLVQGWLYAHQAMHQALRDLTGLTGIDLQSVDFTDPTQFYLWSDSHATEHSDLEQALGAL